VREFDIPDFCMVILIGGSASFRHEFARRHFKDCDRICSIEGAGSLIEAQLADRRLTVVSVGDATDEELHAVLAHSRSYHALAIAIVLAEEDVASIWRTRGLDRMGFCGVYFHQDLWNHRRFVIRRVPVWSDKRQLAGPFDIIGDIHGCADALQRLLAKLGYEISWYERGDHDPLCFIIPPANRIAVFVGDLCGSGPDNEGVLRLVDCLESNGLALRVWGDLDDCARLARVRQNWADSGYREHVTEFNDSYTIATDFKESLNASPAVSHLWLDDGELVVTHAAIREDMIGRTSKVVRNFCIYGSCEAGEIEKLDWVERYSGKAAVVFGHTPCKSPRWRNNTIGINTDCVNGGALTALRWPERELVSVEAKGRRDG
jgi:protein phosphatase